MINWQEVFCFGKDRFFCLLAAENKTMNEIRARDPPQSQGDISKQFDNGISLSPFDIDPFSVAAQTFFSLAGHIVTSPRLARKQERKTIK